MAVLLATLRPVGDLGDQSDATLVQRVAFNATTLQVPQTILAIGDLAAAPDGIEFLRFFARVGFFPSGFGPLDPFAWVRWRLGAAGTLANSDPTNIPGGVGVYSEVSASIDVPLDPDGNPWSLATVNNIRMAGAFGVIDDQGSGESTTCQVTELWAEVWAPDPPPPTSPHETEQITLAVDGDESATLAGEGDFALTLECGSSETLACEGDLSITLQCDVDEEV
jgi:hypothetical protein